MVFGSSFWVTVALGVCLALFLRNFSFSFVTQEKQVQKDNLMVKLEQLEAKVNKLIEPKNGKELGKSDEKGEDGENDEIIEDDEDESKKKDATKDGDTNSKSIDSEKDTSGNTKSETNQPL